MKETRNEIENDLILGSEEIVSFVGQSIDILVFHWKPEHNFPIFKYNGFPAISRKALDRWRQNVANGLPLEEITTLLLEKLHYRRKLESIKSQEIKGLENICRVVRHSPDQILRWIREYDTPIRKLGSGGNNLVVDIRSLLLWLADNGLQRGDYVPPRVSIRVDRGDGNAPEFY